MKKIIFILSLMMLLLINIKAQETSYICEGDTKTLTCTATGGSGSEVITWTDPSGNTTTGATTTADEAGTYTWEITDGGCTASGTHIVNIEADPTAGIIINATDVCINTVQTISASGVPAGYSYSWNFGTDASPPTSTLASDDVEYSSAGSKTITLTIEKSFTGSTNGCNATCSWTVTKTITVTDLQGSSSCGI